MKIISKAYLEMNGIVVINKLANYVEGRIVLIIGHILTIQQRLIIFSRRRRRDWIDRLERVLEHNRVGVFGRKFNSQLKRLFAYVRLCIIRLPIELKCAKVRRYNRFLFELFGIFFWVCNEKIVKQTLFVRGHKLVEEGVQIGQEVKFAFFITQFST